MKLHYSQTKVRETIANNKVSVPYEITLLSNAFATLCRPNLVSVPYEITLLSNYVSMFEDFRNVSVPYEITLLSNARCSIPTVQLFQYLMKLHYSQTCISQALQL